MTLRKNKINFFMKLNRMFKTFNGVYSSSLFYKLNGRTVKFDIN